LVITNRVVGETNNEIKEKGNRDALGAGIGWVLRDVRTDGTYLCYLQREQQKIARKDKSNQDSTDKGPPTVGEA